MYTSSFSELEKKMPTTSRASLSRPTTPLPNGIISRSRCGLVAVKARSYERLSATVVWKVISRERHE